ncbi:uncharacterized protein [Nicotiana sylvestris]|uniref:uncharacterized protein n=1 Tax=Nicotiana sylvestris TaxID=4096 RepID=UPI00388CC7C9
MSQLQQKLDMIGQLRGEVDQVRAKCNEWKAKIDTLVVAKNDALAKVLALEVQLRNAQGSNLVQAGSIAELEADLAKAKARVVEVRAEANEIQAKVDKTVAIYLKDVVDAQMELRGGGETLEEVHAKGFDLSEEIKQAKADEADAKFVLSSDDDDDVEDDEGEEIAEEATPREEDGPGEVTSPGGNALWCR